LNIHSHQLKLNQSKILKIYVHEIMIQLETISE